MTLGVLAERRPMSVVVGGHLVDDLWCHHAHAGRRDGAVPGSAARGADAVVKEYYYYLRVPADAER